MSSFCGATDTPVSDFWWCLLWVSKLEWAALFVLCRGVHITHSLRFISGVTPADLLVASMAAEPSLPHTCKALVGLETRRSGRRSTDWAIPAQLQLENVTKITLSKVWSQLQKWENADFRPNKKCSHRVASHKILMSSKIWFKKKYIRLFR